MSFRLHDLTGKRALVTGAASGIGRATALALADQGAALFLCDVNEAGLRDVEREVAARSRCLLARRVDVASRDQMRAFADAIHAQVPALDVLINNAGVGLSGGILTTTLDDWDWVLSINLKGVVHGCHFFVPGMVARGQGGCVVNVSSMAGYFGAPDMLGYVTSKFAVFGLSESLREELRPHGIGVAVICPGIVDTDIIRTTRMRTAPGLDPEQVRARVSKLYRQRNFTPERVGQAVVAAIRDGREVVPVTAEAWAFYLLSRLAPGLGHRIGALMGRSARK